MPYLLKRFYFIPIFSFLIALGGCSKKSDGNNQPPPTPPSAAINSVANIDRSQKFQTIDGFGFFGAQDVWWSDAAKLYSDDWAKQVINDLGITIWRTELNAPATNTAPQDADWNKQKPTIEGLKKIADDNRVPLKFIFTVWSPPADMKCALDANDNALPGTPNRGETKNGGTLDPNKYTAYGNWLAAGVQLFKDAGINVYAVSPQNEPLFKQFFNSCFYRPVDQYPDMIKNVIPVLKSKYPSVKVFGSENMLEMEGGKDRQYFYNANMVKNPDAFSKIDVLAVHGYSDGVSPSSSSVLAQLWNTTKTEHAVPSGKPYWMTETSGYIDSWKGTTTKPSGAINLAMDIHAALVYGNAQAWVWWQGSNMSGIDEFSLMQGTQKRGKKYYASKHFYRFIRPGAVRVQLTTEESKGIYGSAFENNVMNAFTIVLINNSEKEVSLKLEGNNLPDNFDYYLTTSNNTDNCTKQASAVSKNDINLPAYSVVTLVNGQVFE